MTLEAGLRSQHRVREDQALMQVYRLLSEAPPWPCGEQMSLHHQYAPTLGCLRGPSELLRDLACDQGCPVLQVGITTDHCGQSLPAERRALGFVSHLKLTCPVGRRGPAVFPSPRDMNHSTYTLFSFSLKHSPCLGQHKDGSFLSQTPN